MNRLQLLVVVGSIVLAAGCTVATNPDLVLPYQCDPASALGDSQCAGGWKCAADGVCRDPSLGVASGCETSADCLGGWHCGVSRTCYDRSTASAIPCRPDGEPDGGSDCRDGWRCPSGGICQEVGVFAPYPCQATADCEGGGHCGLLARCYQRDQAQDIPCRPELDTDPAARDCAPNWVCSANGRCVDAHDYDLQPNGPVSALQVRTVPATGAGPVDHLSAECYRPTEMSCSGTTALTVARGATLELHRIPSAGAVAPPTVLTLSGPIDALATTTLPGGVQQAYSLVRVGTDVLHVSWPPSGPPVVTPITVPFTPLRLLAPAGTPWFLGISGPDLFFVQRDTGAVIGSVGLPGSVNYREVSAFSLSSATWMVALSDQGAYAARVTGNQFDLIDGGTQALPEWSAVRIPGASHPACPGDDGGTGTILALSQTGSGSTGSGTFRSVWVGLVPAEGPLAGRPSGYTVSVRLDSTPSDCASIASAAPSATCPLCPGGSTLVSLNGLNGVLCQTALSDGGLSVAEVSVSSSCVEPTVIRERAGAAAASAIDPGEHLAWGYGSASGQVIVRSVGVSAGVPLLLDRAPTHLSLGTDGGVAAHDGLFAYGLGDAGFELSVIDQVLRCATIHDAEDHQLASSSSVAVNVTGPEGLVTLSDSNGVPINCSPDVPLLGEKVLLSDGGTGAIIAGRDRVWGGRLPLVPGQPWPVRVAPASFANITSLTALRPSPISAPWASAFVLANAQVHALRADAENRWSSTAVPGPSGDPFAVWADPALGRVTFVDGTTYSLPLYSPLAGPLPEPAPTVRALSEICGTAYVLGNSGLFRLDQDGTWHPVPAAPQAALWSALERIGDTLYGFTDDGKSYVVTDTNCPRP